MNSPAYISLTGYRVIELATPWLKAYRQIVQERREPMIQRHMQRTRWQRLTGAPARTREQAIEHLKNSFDGLESYWAAAARPGSYQAGLVERLLNMAVEAGPRHLLIDTDLANTLLLFNKE